jgi:hypothetical protein
MTRFALTITLACLAFFLVAATDAGAGLQSFSGRNGALAGGGCEPGNLYDCGLYLQTSGGSHRILSHGRFFIQQPHWSPGGNRIAYVVVRNAPSELRVVNADGSGDRLVLQDSSLAAGDWTWTRDGRHIVFVGGNPVRMVLVDVDKQVAPGHEADRIVRETDMLAAVGWYALEVAASPTTDRLAVRYYNQSTQLAGLALVDVDGQNLQSLLTVSPEAQVRHEELWGIEWAPDGARLAYLHTVLDDTIGKATTRPEWIPIANPAQVHVVVDYPKGDRENGAAYVESVKWSPDGEWIAFKTIQGMLPKWEAIRPDSTGRTSFGALYGEIDWQACSTSCAGFSPGAAPPPPPPTPPVTPPPPTSTPPPPTSTPTPPTAPTTSSPKRGSAGDFGLVCGKVSGRLDLGYYGRAGYGKGDTVCTLLIANPVVMTPFRERLAATGVTIKTSNFTPLMSAAVKQAIRTLARSLVKRFLQGLAPSLEIPDSLALQPAATKTIEAALLTISPRFAPKTFLDPMVAAAKAAPFGVVAKSTYVGLTRYHACVQLTWGFGHGKKGKLIGPIIHGAGKRLPWAPKGTEYATLVGPGNRLFSLPVRCTASGAVVRATGPRPAPYVFSRSSTALVTLH